MGSQVVPLKLRLFASGGHQGVEGPGSEGRRLYWMKLEVLDTEWADQEIGEGNSLLKDDLASGDALKKRIEEGRAAFLNPPVLALHLLLPALASEPPGCRPKSWP